MSVITNEFFDNSELDVETYDLPETPDIKGVLSVAIQATGDLSLRRALQAESSGEMSEELKAYLYSIIGIKLIGIQKGDKVLVTNAELLFLDAMAGDSVAVAMLDQAITAAEQHDDDVSRARTESRRQGLVNEGFDTMEGLVQKESGLEQLTYAHLSAVHATDYEPIRHRNDGRLHIEDTYSSTGKPRNTVHVALNHMVESSSFSSSWDDKRVVIVSPMDGLVGANGEPSSLIGHDTWWEVSPLEGLALPDSTIIIKPGANQPIRKILEKGEIRYKVDGVTEEDVEEILAMADDYELYLMSVMAGKNFFIKPDNHSRTGTLGDTNLRQHEMKFSISERAEIKDILRELFKTDKKEGQRVFSNLAKRVAVREALELQGREVLEPITTMDASFASEDINGDLLHMSLRKGMTGHHSESTIGGLEKWLLRYLEDGTPEERQELIEYIREEVAGEVNVATLQMLYRLGLF